MGVFGVQLVLTMIVASFLHKIAPYYSFGRWVLTAGLLRYLPPSDKLLRPHIANPPTSKTTKKKAANQREKILSSPDSTPEEILEAMNYDPNTLDQNLAVPKSANIKLETVPITWNDFEQLHFSTDLEFLINLALAAVSVFLLTLVYYLFKPEAVAMEYNLSVIWLVVLVGYVFKVLGSLTRVYVSDELSHQRSLIIVFTLLLFVCVLGILLVDESVLDFGLDKSHQKITKSLKKLLEGILKHAAKDFQIMPMWTFKIALALLCGVISVALVFPGLRFADMHFNVILLNRAPLFKTLLHANYIAPMFCLSLWIRPLTQEVIAERSNVNILSLVEVSYDTFRALMVMCVCVLRLSLARVYFQNYLNTARWKIENLKSEPGRITILNLRKKVSNIFLFYGALGVHYIAPYVILLSVTLMMMLSSSSASLSQSVSSADVDPQTENVNVFRYSGLGTAAFQGCFAFVCWWVCFTNAITSGFGAILREYI